MVASSGNNTLAVSNVNNTSYIEIANKRICLYHVNTNKPNYTCFVYIGRIEGSCAVMPPHADKIFVGSHDYCMYALNSENGEISWKYKTGGIIKCTPCATSSFIIFGKNFFNISQIWYIE